MSIFILDIAISVDSLWIGSEEEGMGSDLYFDECKDCEFQDCVDSTFICLGNRLRLAWHKMLLETPVIRDTIDKCCFCYGFVRKERKHDQL